MAIFFFNLFADTSNIISFEVISGNLLFIFDRIIICKAVTNIHQSDNSSWSELGGFDTYTLSKLIAD